MSGTTKGNMPISKNTVSPSRKLSKSSKTRITLLSETRTRSKNSTKSQGGASATRNTSSSSSAIARSKKEKTSTESSAQEEQLQRRREIWKDYDYDEMPELNDAQLADFAENAMTPEEFKKYRAKRLKERQKKSSS